MPFGGVMHCRPAKIRYMASKICPVEHRARSELRVDEVDFVEELGQAEVDIAGERRRAEVGRAGEP